MTRINCGIEPCKLSNKHLIAEHREIKRIPNAVCSGKAIVSDIPEVFTLGKGHVKFFYNKMLFLKKRYDRLYQECIDRGFKVQYYGSAWDKVPSNLMGDYVPNESDIALIINRIKERS